MHLNAYLKHFLENTVNLNQSRIDDLDKRVVAITNYLEAETTLGPIVIELIPQGSYAHKTIIKPIKGRDFDADVLLHFTEQPGWEPKDYIAELYAAFRRSSTYHDLVDRKTRCVTVDYAGDFHIDVVPYLERGGADHYITNRHENRFELTNPEGFNDWLDRQNRIAKNHLVEAIRLTKFIRDSKSTFSIKSLILTTLLGGTVDEVHLWGDPDYYKDMPTALLHIVGDLDTYLQAHPTMPWIGDPSGTGENFGDRWAAKDPDGYAIFRDKLHFYAGKFAAAYAEPDKAKSIALWQEVFGPNFQAPPAAPTLAKTASVPAVPTTEQFLDVHYGIQRIPSKHKVMIKGRILPKKGFRTCDLSARGNRVEKGRWLRFDVTSCNVPKPYEVYWKVRNTGEEAARVGQLRGEITPDAGSETKRESTAYRGSHYVECFIVKNGMCLASDKQLVFVV
jgi:hypothetical protein